MGVKRWIVAIVVLVLVLGSLALLTLQSGADTVLLEKVLPRVEQRLGVVIEVEDIDVSLTSAVLHRVTIRPAGADALPLARIERVGIGVRVGPLLMGNIALTGVRIEGLKLFVGARVGGATVEEWREIIDRATKGGDSFFEGAPGSDNLAEVLVVSGSIIAALEVFEVSVDGLSGRWNPGVGGELSMTGIDASHQERRFLSGAAGEIRALPRTSRPGEERFVLVLDRPEFEVLASREELATLARDADAVLAEFGGAADPGAAADGGSGPSMAGLPLRLELTGATLDLVDPEDPSTRVRFADIRGDAALGGSLPFSMRIEGNLPGTPARFILAARGPGKEGLSSMELEVPDLSLNDVGRLLLPREEPIWDRASLDGTLALELPREGTRMGLRGQVSFTGLGLRHDRISGKTLVDLDAHADFKITWDREHKAIRMERFQISRGRSHFTLRGDIDTQRLAFDVVLNLPPTPCRHVFAAIPREFREDLGDARFEGNFGLGVRAALDVDAPGETVLEIDLDNRCAIAEWGEIPSPDQYRGPFTYMAYDEQEERLRLVSGPGTDRWTDLALISPYLVEAALTTEDGKFRRHSGTTVPELRRAIELNLRNRSLTHGASTITMQLAKNLFLSRERTVERKLRELFFTWYLETYFKKDEILELYFNVVEFGPSIYGIYDASHHYFGREPHELNLAESVFLIKLLPSPVRRYAAYRRGEVSERMTASLHRTMRIMRSRGRITEAELQEGLSQDIRFHREGDPLPPPRVPPERGGFRLSRGTDDWSDDDPDPDGAEAAIWEQ